MTRAEYGYLCPEGHGLLLGRDGWVSRGVVWCGHEDHGGNGRFFRISEVVEGIFSPRSYQVQNELQTERMRAVLAAAEEKKMAARAAAAAAAAPKTTKPTRRLKAVPAAKPARGPRECECECGGTTKGGRFLPGHDAKLHARLRAEAAAKAAPVTSDDPGAADAAEEADAAF